MGPKVKFSKEQIVEAAFEIAKAEGIDNITIRKVAEKLGSSVAPIYVNFNDMDELKAALIPKVMEISQQILATQSTGSPFLDIGMASLQFAKEYSVLYRDLVMKSNSYMSNYDQDLGGILVEQMKEDAELRGFDEEELQTMLFKMRVFQVGLSVMVANGLLPREITDQDLMELLESSAEDVISTARLRKSGQMKGE